MEKRLLLLPKKKRKERRCIDIICWINIYFFFLFRLLNQYNTTLILFPSVTTSIISKGLESQAGTFTLTQIKDATDDFDEDNKIGEGGFGPVYKVYIK